MVPYTTTMSVQDEVYEEDDSVLTEDDQYVIPVHTPPFVHMYEDHGLHPPEIAKNELTKKNWITPELQKEINDCSPRSSDIDCMKDNARDSESFKKNV